MSEGLSLTAPVLSPWSFKWHSWEQWIAIGTAAQCLETVFPDVLKLCVLPGGADFVINAVPCSGIHLFTASLLLLFCWFVLKQLYSSMLELFLFVLMSSLPEEGLRRKRNLASFTLTYLKKHSLTNSSGTLMLSLVPFWTVFVVLFFPGTCSTQSKLGGDLGRGRGEAVCAAYWLSKAQSMHWVSQCEELEWSPEGETQNLTNGASCLKHWQPPPGAVLTGLQGKANSLGMVVWVLLMHLPLQGWTLCCCRHTAAIKRSLALDLSTLIQTTEPAQSTLWTLFGAAPQSSTRGRIWCGSSY